ncbi:EAL domain, c-di-GMP-specific phosphodiesterase class I (or its enzymatically inactive variant) [Hydrocarboniphaga daqingensis]|uniref:EAL domain, c-di-GMP-specific phosphodiesterase class I (Or its enzymatically inactive variant) n=1 Tax=Hydrocarboniphaga daqingensis TaxID=490188 RepID=A0A1M5K693_9GAMM|nr:EAL domain, c-di-GMP-specific phosphodiesterase class I (or its enzymatically inactive variant) [Hydrocarboniphaga daqingensis]
MQCDHERRTVAAHPICIGSPIRIEERDDDQSTGQHDAASRGPVKGSGYTKLLETLNRWQPDTAAALFYVNLCHLRSVNRLATPAVADRLVADVGKRLQKWAGPDGLSARLWSDEFIAIKTMDHAQQSADEAKSLRDALTELRYTGSHGASQLAVSIGVVPLRMPLDWPATLGQAEEACENAKMRGLNQISFHSSMTRVSRPHGGSDAVTEFRRYLDHHQLSLQPQPIMDIRAREPRIAKAEFLLRIEREPGVWSPPPPGMIEALEVHGLSTELDSFSAQHLLAWIDEHRSLLDRLDGVSLNLSAPSFIDGLFMGKFFDEVRHARLPRNKLCIEITETAAIKHLNVAAEVILDFKTLGCRFSLDDFGSGLCSFGYLHSLPVDEVKIDGTFIRELAHSSVSEKIVRAIYQVARATGKTTVAEFVDDPRKLAVLQEIGFDYAQGWLFYPSIPSERLIELVMVDRRASRAMVAD